MLNVTNCSRWWIQSYNYKCWLLSKFGLGSHSHRRTNLAHLNNEQWTTNNVKNYRYHKKKSQNLDGRHQENAREPDKFQDETKQYCIACGHSLDQRCHGEHCRHHRSLPLCPMLADDMNIDSSNKNTHNIW